MDLGGFAIKSTIKLATGRLIPRIGYGTYQLKGDDCVGGVKAALKHGYRHIDTASIYKN
jgi:diketogulonate reductase-like aldo/keto reductase